jgi:hypothetical protein
MPKNDLEKIHEHHIIPRYKCKELGIDKDFTGNTIYLTRLEHAWVHWWMWCNEKKDVYNLLESKGVDLEGIQMPNSTGCIKNHIPWHDRNDSGAAGVVGLGQIDGIDQTGENNNNWIDGRTLDMKAYNARAEVKERRRKGQLTPEYKEKFNAYMEEYSQRPEVKERARKREQTSEYKAWKKEYYQRKKHPILDICSGAIL